MKKSGWILCFLVSTISVSNATTLELLQQACNDPGSVGNQNPPSQINVVCQETIANWIVSATKTMPVSHNDSMVISATTDKPNTSSEPESFSVPTPVTLGCTFSEQKRTHAALNVQTNCEEIITLTSLDVWCHGKVAAAAEGNPGFYTTTPTGRTFNVCPEEMPPVPGTPTEPVPPTEPSTPTEPATPTQPGTPTQPSTPTLPGTPTGGPTPGSPTSSL